MMLKIESFPINGSIKGSRVLIKERNKQYGRIINIIIDQFEGFYIYDVGSRAILEPSQDAAGS